MNNEFFYNKTNYNNKYNQLSKNHNFNNKKNKIRIKRLIYDKFIKILILKIPIILRIF